MTDHAGAAPPLRIALQGRCPRCGRGPLFAGMLRFKPACKVCALPLAPFDTGDGAAMAGIFVVGTVAVIAAIVTDIRYEPPLWVHALLWPLPVALLAVWVTRVAKAGLAMAQYRHRQGESES